MFKQMKIMLSDDNVRIQVPRDDTYEHLIPSSRWKTCIAIGLSPTHAAPKSHSLPPQSPTVDLSALYQPTKPTSFQPANPNLSKLGREKSSPNGLLKAPTPQPEFLPYYMALAAPQAGTKRKLNISLLIIILLSHLPLHSVPLPVRSSFRRGGMPESSYPYVAPKEATFLKTP